MTNSMHLLTEKVSAAANLLWSAASEEESDMALNLLRVAITSLHREVTAQGEVTPASFADRYMSALEAERVLTQTRERMTDTLRFARMVEGERIKAEVEFERARLERVGNFIVALRLASAKSITSHVR